MGSSLIYLQYNKINNKKLFVLPKWDIDDFAVALILVFVVISSHEQGKKTNKRQHKHQKTSS